MALLPMGALARHHALRKPGDAVALSYPEGELSWQALDARSSRRARLLQARGVKAGDFVTLALPNGLVLYESVFAIWKLGAIPNVVSPRLAPAEAAARAVAMGSSERLSCRAACRSRSVAYSASVSASSLGRCSSDSSAANPSRFVSTN